MESLRGQEVEYCVPEGELTSAPQLQRRKPGADFALAWLMVGAARAPARLAAWLNHGFTSSWHSSPRSPRPFAANLWESWNNRDTRSQRKATIMDDKELTEKAIRLAVENVADGGGPFGAVLVTANGNEYDGANRVTAINDPTAHAEVMAIRKAAAAEGFDLSGSVLYASCEPCPMCLTAALWARVDRIIYAATQDDAAAAGFDDSSFYTQLRHGLKTVEDAEITHLKLSDRRAPFQAWDANTAHTAY